MLRLECLRGLVKGQRIYRYLIIAGKSEHFRKQLLEPGKENTSRSKATLIDGVLGRTGGETKPVTYKDLDPSHQKMFDSFAKDYDRLIPARFDIRLEFAIDNGEFCVYGWHIQCSSNRKEVSPGTNSQKNPNQRNPQTPLSEPVTSTPAQTKVISP